jgi:DNA invertase Pin-like site-specific DNA recombinase
VAVYKDIERYRVGRRLVEPSGTRADRPGLKAILEGARAGQFEIIIAWREDRLYRGYRPMVEVLDCLEACKAEVELVKEFFDKRMVPVKMWAGRQELDAIRERFKMGIKDRLYIR